jgi:tripartite-type tricarboxylate transporter receptor subunit TctC
MPDIRNRMITQGADPAYLDSEAFSAFLNKQMPVWAQAVKQSGARLD